MSDKNSNRLLNTTIEVTCPDCHDTYNIRTNRHIYIRNCRCSRGSFEVQLSSGYGHVRVYYINSVSLRSEFTNWRIIAQS